jgi:hypothetical protein
VLIDEGLDLLRGAVKLERSRGARGVGFDVVQQELATAHVLFPRYSIQLSRLSGPFRKAKPSLSRRKIDEHEHAIERFKKRQDYSYIRVGIMLDVLSTLAEVNLMARDMVT